MRKQYLHTLPIALMTRLHKKIGRGYRSQFVEKAITARLNNEEAFDLDAISTRELLFELAYRSELPKSARSYINELYREVKQ